MKSFDIFQEKSSAKEFKLLNRKSNYFSQTQITMHPEISKQQAATVGQRLSELWRSDDEVCASDTNCSSACRQATSSEDP